MIYTDQWPEWLKYVVLIPHAILLWVLVWFWWPKSTKAWCRASGLFVYLIIVYFVILRSMKF